jgi:dihydrofolate synthase/folylpolyglutamate synthase
MPQKTTSRSRARKPSSARPKAASVAVPKSSPPDATTIVNYPSAVKWLLERTDIERLRIVRYNEETFKLERMQAILEQLGNPHEQFRSIHIAGTNGKGSTIAMMSAMLQECGYAVGEFTSPHLVDVRERIAINGTLMARPTFTEMVKRISEACGKIGEDPNYFEVITAIGFLTFAEEAVDIALIECGLGGRLDSTNVLMPVLSVITRIQKDHTKLLGDTLASIAAEKAGILKPGVPAITLKQDDEVARVLEETAARVGTTIKTVEKEVEFSSRFCSADELGPHTRVCLYTPTSRLEHIPVPLPGEHQAPNCGVALAAVDHLKSIGFDCPEEIVTKGLVRTSIKGRMDLVWDQPRIILDGAHNPEALGALMRCVGSHVPYDSMVCIFGCAQDKDVDGLLTALNLGADKVIFTKAVNSPRACETEDLRRRFTELSGKMCQTAPNIKAAIKLAVRAVSREDLVCVTGSFHLVGETMKHLEAVKAAQAKA